MRPDSLSWLGHAGLRLDVAGVRVLTDPVLRDRVGPLRRYGPRPQPALWQDPDLVLVSHLHHDHLDLPSLALLPRSVPVVVPSGAGPLLRRHGHTDVREVRVGDDVRLGAVTVTVVPAHHGGDRVGTRLHSPALGYLIRGGGQRIWFAGDTGRFEAMRDLRGEVDLALLPVGGWGPTLGPEHLDPLGAAEVAALVGARRAVPIHWGTLLLPGLRTLRPALSREPGERFRAHAAQVARDTEVFVMRASTEIGMP